MMKLRIALLALLLAGLTGCGANVKSINPELRALYFDQRKLMHSIQEELWPMDWLQISILDDLTVEESWAECGEAHPFELAPDLKQALKQFFEASNGQVNVIELYNWQSGPDPYRTIFFSHHQGGPYWSIAYSPDHSNFEKEIRTSDGFYLFTTSFERLEKGWYIVEDYLWD